MKRTRHLHLVPRLMSGVIPLLPRMLLWCAQGLYLHSRLSLFSGIYKSFESSSARSYCRSSVIVRPVWSMNLLRNAERICINFYTGTWELHENFNDTWFKSYKSSK